MPPRKRKSEPRQAQAPAGVRESGVRKLLVLLDDHGWWAAPAFLLALVALGWVAAPEGERLTREERIERLEERLDVLEGLVVDGRGPS